jgi:hypothetical protein
MMIAIRAGTQLSLGKTAGLYETRAASIGCQGGDRERFNPPRLRAVRAVPAGRCCRRAAPMTDGFACVR